MNYFTIRAVALLCLMKTASCLAIPEPLDSTAIIVNKGVILESEINDLMQTIQWQARQSGQPLPENIILRKQVCEHLIMDSLQQQLATQLGLQVLDNEVMQMVAEIAQQHQLTPETLRSRLIQEGGDWLVYYEQLRKDLLTKKVRQHQVQQRINILPQEVDVLAKQLAQQSRKTIEIVLSKILLALPEEASDSQTKQTKQLANQIIKQLRQGDDFKQLAMMHSAEPQAWRDSQETWTRLEALPTLFAEKLSAAHKGDVIGPIRTGVGFYILRVDDLRGKEPTTVELHARHILLKSSPIKSEEQIRAQLREFAKQIKNKEKTFGELAQRYSQDPGSAAKGGDLGWATPDSYDPQFAKVLQELPLNQLSSPVRTEFGWHLIECLGNRQATISEDSCREQAMRLLWQRKMTEEVNNWLQEQRAAAYIKMLKPTA